MCVYIWETLQRPVVHNKHYSCYSFLTFFYNFVLLHVFEYAIMIWGYYVRVHAGDGLEVRDVLITERATAVAGFLCQKCLEA